MKKTALILVSVLLLSGCATVGNKSITQNNVISQIEIGKSTKDEVKTLLGKPSKVTFTDTNEEVWDYVYSRSTMRPTSVIPIIGIFAGGSDIKNNTLTIRFTKDGIVKAIGRGETTGGAGSVFD